MITETDLRLIQHRSGRYLWIGYATNEPHGHVPYGAAVYRLTRDLMDAARGEARFTAGSYLGERDGWEPGQFSLVPAPVCGCCGEGRVVRHRNGCWSPYRCEKHAGRNPCAIEDCTRTTAAPDGQLANNQYLCGEHWRRFVPPRSRLRRAYNAFFRRAKRHGWDEDLKRRFWRFWNAVIRQARRRATEGHLDETAINKMFGWAE
jgi:hypothetical protein